MTEIKIQPPTEQSTVNHKPCGSVVDHEDEPVHDHDCTNYATRISHVYESFSVYVCDIDHVDLEPWMEDTIEDLPEAAEARAANQARQAPTAPTAVVKRLLPIPPAGAFCDHTEMVEHCKGCGHLSCPCGIEWDEGAER